jgi:hypothetical protein
MHVTEESHCGIVPMNHSNNDGTLSAESEEGRLRIKENTLRLDPYPTQRGAARRARIILRASGCRWSAFTPKFGQRRAVLK